jgi:diaminopimelate epimerase
MKKIHFTKMVASGNDFVVVENSHKTEGESHRALAKKICDRKYGVGADGLLLLEGSKKADIRMRIFNADGSEAEMCGNGARCTALYVSQEAGPSTSSFDKLRTSLRAGKRTSGQQKITIETKAGIIDSEIIGDKVKIKLTDPEDVRLEIPIKVNNRTMRVNFITTGVPHAVIFTEGLEEIDIVPLGRAIRNHKKFLPRGTNVDFVEVVNKNAINVRTYERGVEDETLACGTGSAASALVFALKTGAKDKVYVHTKSTEVLTVYFNSRDNSLKDIWLEGKARLAFQGAGSF